MTARDIFFAKLWEEDAYRRLFFAHRSRLFARIEDDRENSALLPVLFAGSMPAPSAEHVLAASAELQEAKRTSAMEQLEGKFDTAAGDLKTLGCMLVLRFVDQNPALRSLIDEGRLGWADVALVANGDLDLDIFREFKDRSVAGSESRGDDTHDPVLRTKAARYVDELRHFATSGDFLRFAQAIDQATAMIPLYALCREQSALLLTVRRVSQGAYGGVLRDLYLKKLLTNISTTFWCQRCEDEPCVLTSTARLSPAQLAISCPKCDLPMLSATLYQVHNEIRDACFSQDGLLGEAVSWLLTKRAISFERGAYTAGFETDYVITLGDQRVLLECKVHKSDKDSEIVQRQLAKAVGQAAKHAAALKKEGALSRVWVLTNHSLDDRADEVRQVQKHRAAEMKQHDISILDASSFLDLLEGLT